MTSQRIDFQGIFYRFDDSGVLREEAYCDPIKAEFRHWNEDGTLRRATVKAGVDP